MNCLAQAPFVKHKDSIIGLVTHLLHYAAEVLSSTSITLQVYRQGGGESHSATNDKPLYRLVVCLPSKGDKVMVVKGKG